MEKEVTLYTVAVRYGEDNAKVDIFRESFDAQLAKEPSIFTFWVPMASLDEHGFVPASIIRARFKQRFKTHLGHFSYTTYV